MKSPQAMRWIAIAALFVVIGIGVSVGRQGSQRQVPSHSTAGIGAADERDLSLANGSSSVPLPVAPPQGHPGRRADGQKDYDATASFAAQMDCMSYRRFSRLFKAQATNPDFPLNNEASLREMPRAEQKLLMDRVQLVKDREADCEEASVSVSDVDATFAIYDAAFSAAMSGDVYAGVCYAMAPWGFPNAPSAKSAALRAQYTQYAKKFVDSGVDNGSWHAVRTANNLMRTEHGPSALVNWPPVEAYVFARLLQLGSADPLASNAYGYEAARHSERLDASLLDAGDKKASEIFRTKLSGRIMNDEEKYENCGN